jgi:hypothetical protein
MTPRREGIHEIYWRRSRIDEEHGQSKKCGETLDFPWLGMYVKDEWQQP